MMADAAHVSSWRCPPPHIDPARILRVHRYRDHSKVRPIIRQAAQTAAETALGLCSPDARYVTQPIDKLDGGRLALASGITFTCSAFARHLPDAMHLLAFVMTIGPDLDANVSKLIEDDDDFQPLEALFLETAGWLAIETATKQMAAALKERYAERGWRLSLRMGPGYDYPSSNGSRRERWDLTEQRGLFAMFGADQPPVELMDSCAMKPKMSRSGVFGLSPLSR